MNFSTTIATLFPGAAGRTIAELTRRRLRGEEVVETLSVAAAAAVVPGQLTKVATRLALLGLLRFPIGEQITIVRENIIWDALADLLDPHRYLDTLVHEAVSVCPDISRAVIAGPVPAGTAQSFPEGIAVAIVSDSAEVSEAQRSEISRRISAGIGNDCTVTVVTDLSQAMQTLPLHGRRIIDRPRPATSSSQHEGGDVADHP